MASLLGALNQRSVARGSCIRESPQAPAWLGLACLDVAWCGWRPSAMPSWLHQETDGRGELRTSALIWILLEETVWGSGHPPPPAEPGHMARAGLSHNAEIISQEVPDVHTWRVFQKSVWKLDFEQYHGDSLLIEAEL